MVESNKQEIEMLNDVCEQVQSIFKDTSSRL